MKEISTTTSEEQGHEPASPVINANEHDSHPPSPLPFSEEPGIDLPSPSASATHEQGDEGTSNRAVDELPGLASHVESQHDDEVTASLPTTVSGIYGLVNAPVIDDEPARVSSGASLVKHGTAKLRDGYKSDTEEDSLSQEGPQTYANKDTHVVGRGEDSENIKHPVGSQNKPQNVDSTSIASVHVAAPAVIVLQQQESTADGGKAVVIDNNEEAVAGIIGGEEDVKLSSNGMSSDSRKLSKREDHKDADYEPSDSSEDPEEYESDAGSVTDLEDRNAELGTLVSAVNEENGDASNPAGKRRDSFKDKNDKQPEKPKRKASFESLDQGARKLARTANNKEGSFISLVADVTLIPIELHCFNRKQGQFVPKCLYLLRSKDLHATKDVFTRLYTEAIENGDLFKEWKYHGAVKRYSKQRQAWTHVGTPEDLRQFIHKHVREIKHHEHATAEQRLGCMVFRKEDKPQAEQAI